MEFSCQVKDECDQTDQQDEARPDLCADAEAGFVYFLVYDLVRSLDMDVRLGMRGPGIDGLSAGRTIRNTPDVDLNGRYSPGSGDGLLNQFSVAIQFLIAGLYGSSACRPADCTRQSHVPIRRGRETIVVIDRYVHVPHIQIVRLGSAGAFVAAVLYDGGCTVGVLLLCVADLVDG